jgi:hypothetical protein
LGIWHSARIKMRARLGLLAAGVGVAGLAVGPGLTAVAAGPAQGVALTSINGQPVSRFPVIGGNSLRLGGTATGLPRFSIDPGASQYAKLGSKVDLIGHTINGVGPFVVKWTVDGSTAGLTDPTALQARLDTTNLADGTHDALLDVTDARGIELRKSAKVIVYRELSQVLADQSGTIGPAAPVSGLTPPVQQSVAFTVGVGTGSITGTLHYDPNSLTPISPVGVSVFGAMDLTLTDPAGHQATASGIHDSDPAPIIIDHPAPGNWTATVTDNGSNQTTYEIRVGATTITAADPRPVVSAGGVYNFVQGATQQLHATVGGGIAPVVSAWDLDQTDAFATAGTDPVTSFGLGSHLVTFRAVDARGFDSRQTTAVRVSAPGATGGNTSPYVVVAVADTGINPYHDDFGAARFPDKGILTQTNNFTNDPASYIPGYPARTPSLPVTLGQGYLPAADAHLWDVGGQITTGQLYWIPGTKIIGAMDSGLGDGATGAIDTPAAILDTNGHGTKSASVAVGNIYGSCPTCLLVDIKGLGGETWAYGQPWIDIVSNSYGALANEGFAGLASPTFPQASAERGQLALYAGGNGNEDAFITPEQTYTSDTLGPDWVVRVGAVDRDTRQPFLGTGKPVTVSSFGLGNIPAADWQSSSGEGQHNGTSAATPITAGVFATTLAGVRRALGDTSTGQRPAVGQGVVATGAPIAASPYLNDGILTRSELVEAVVKTTQHGDGPATLSIPEEIPANQFQYAVEGYGIADVDSGTRALQVLMGQGALPDRAAEDSFFANDQALREFMWGTWAGGGANSAHPGTPTHPDSTRFAGVTAAQVSTFLGAMKVMGITRPAGTTTSSSSAATAPSAGVTITSPADGAYFPPGTSTTTATGTASFPAAAYPAQASRFYVRRDSCGTTTDKTYLSRTAAPATDQTDGCSQTLQAIANTGLVDFSTVYPLTGADLPVVLGHGLPFQGVVYEGSTLPGPLSLNIEVRSGADSIGSQTVTQTVLADPTAFPFSIAVPDAFVGRPLGDLQMVVHITQTSGTSWTDSKKAKSYIDVPTTPSLVPAGSGVQVAVDDANFASPTSATVAADGSWSAPVNLAGLASDPAVHHLFARTLSTGAAGVAASAAFTIGVPPPAAGRVQVQVAPLNAVPTPDGWVNATDGGGDGTYSTWSATLDISKLTHGRYQVYYRVLRTDGTTLTPGPLTVMRT